MFQGILDDDLLALTEDAVLARHGDGDILFRQGDPADSFFVVLEGRVVLFLDPASDPAGIARIVGPGETFAEACVCGIGAYPVTAEVLGSAGIVAIGREPLCRLLEQRFDLVLAMLGEMSFRVRGLVKQITDLKMKTAAQRLAVYLIELTNAEEGPAEIRLPYEKKLLASQLGMKPETLSRAFLKLQSVGVRSRKAEDVLRIGDVARLREFSHAAEQDA